jgi:YVTN family beta-propeller protein
VKLKIALIAILAVIPAVYAGIAPQPEQYLSPGEIVTSSDGRLLYVICERSDEVRVVDVATSKVVKRIPVGHVPRGASLSADGSQLYVTNSWSNTVSVIDTAKQQEVKQLPAGSEPISVVPDSTGATLYAANRVSNDVSVIDIQSATVTRALLGGRGTSYLAASPDGNIYSTHIYPNLGAHRAPPQSEITVIDTAKQRVVERKQLGNVAGVFHIAFSRDGKLGVAAQLRPKNLVPLAHVEHGWAFGDSLTVFGDDIGGTVEVPIDELDRYFALPYGVVITPDKSKIYVSTAGSDSLTVIDTAKLISFAHAHPQPFVNDLSASANYVSTRIPVGRNPRGITLAPDGKRLYVANRMDDSISVVDTASNRVVSTIDLGGSKKMTPRRHGEQLFNSARFAFQGQFGCANCHLDATFDGLQWDLEPDGFGMDIVDNRLLEDLAGTEPFKWNGGNPTMAQECGPRTETYFYRSQSYNEQELTDLISYVYSLPLRPNRYRLPNGELTPAQERGKAIFERTVDKTGKPIEEYNQCTFCHSGPKFTNQTLADVETGKKTDRSPQVDVPQLKNVFMTAPYLHDGSANSLEEIWTVYNPNDKHGRTNDMTKDELNDLIEYLRTL